MSTVFNLITQICINVYGPFNLQHASILHRYHLIIFSFPLQKSQTNVLLFGLSLST